MVWRAFTSGGKFLRMRSGLFAMLAVVVSAGAFSSAIPQEAPVATAPVPATAPAEAPPSTLKPYVPSSAASSSSSSTSSARPRPRTPPVRASDSALSGPTAVNPAPLAPAPAVPAKPLPAVVTPGLPVATSVPISADDIETFTDSVVRALMQRDRVLGAQVAVVQGNTPLLVKGYGYDRLAPARRVDPNASLFRVGSVTKTFTWIVARQEIEAGRITLDTPIGEHLGPDIFVEDGRYKPLTLRALMAHASGFEDTSLGHLFQLNGDRLASPDSYFRRHQPRRVREPGQFSTYSNFGVALAATTLSQTAKARDIPSLMEARIFQPLGMDHTTLREPYAADTGSQNVPAPMSTALTSALSDGFIWDGATYKAQPFDHAIAMSGALGASTTARDMSRLMSVMLSNGQADGIALYNAASASAFRTPVMTMPEGYNGWASGLMVRTAPSGYVTYGHGGSTLWFNANLVIVPEMNLGIFIATNTQSGAALADTFPNLLLDHVKGDLIRAPLMPQPSQAFARNKAYYNSLMGSYVSTRRAYGGLEGAITRLINTVEVSVDDDGRLILTTQDGISAYVPASAQGFFNPQDSEDSGPASATGGLHFLFAREGRKATAFEMASNLMRYERVSWIHHPDTLRLLTIVMLATCILVWISLARGLSRHERPTEEQSRATLVSAGLALIWLIAIFTFNTWQVGMASDPNRLFTDWPSGQVQLASWLAIVAFAGTIYQIVTAYFACNETQRFSVSDGWALWQKVAHCLLLAYWAFFIFALAIWGALQPWSW